MNIFKSKKSIKKSIKGYVSENIMFLLYLIISLLLSLTLRTLTVGLSFSVKPFLYDLAISLFLGSFSFLFKPKNRFKYLLILIIFNTVLCIFNSLYYTFYKSFLSVTLIESMIMLKDVKSSVFDKLKPIHFVYTIFPIMYILINNKLHNKKESSLKFKKVIFAGFIVLVISLLTLNKTDINKVTKNWNKEYIMQKFGLYSYTINDFIISLKPKINDNLGYDSASYEFREFYKEELNNRKKQTNRYTNVFEGKNLLVIHAESIQNFLIDLKINDQEITPNLNKLVKESLYFNKFYPQITTGTSSDTEFTFETGLLPSTSGITFVSYYDREYEGLASILKKKGYYTFGMHGNNGDYWNRNAMYQNLGYDKYYSKDSYVVTDDDIIGIGLSDKEFFKQSSIILDNINKNNSPFYGKMITLTNHSPFDQVDKYGELDLTLTYSYKDINGKERKEVKDYLEGTEMGNYLKSAHYADEALGDLFNYLEENGVLDNTVVILYGDHEARISKSEFTYMYNYNPLTDSLLDEDDENYVSFENYKYDLIKNTPLIIWTKDHEYVDTIDSVMGMYDLLPTLANMFNFNYKYAVGHDIFSNYEKIVVFPNGNFLTDKVYYNSLKGDYITLTEEPISEDYIERLKKYSDIRLSISNNIITHDLIRKEKSNLEKELKNER